MIVTAPDYMDNFQMPVNQSKLTKFLSVFFLIRKILIIIIIIIIITHKNRMINNYSGI